MSGAQRRKGADGEREFRDLLRAHGFDAERDGSRHGDLRGAVVRNLHIEVKRAERLRIPDWLRQCEADAGGRTPVLAFRCSRQPWRVVLPADWFFQLLANYDLLKTMTADE